MITKRSQITPVWLEAILKQQGYLNDGIRISHLSEFSKPLSRFGLSHRFTAYYLLEQPSSPHPPMNFYLKGQKGAFRDGEQEVIFYQRIAPLMSPSLSPNCYIAEYDKETGDYCILLRDLSISHYVLDPEVPAQVSDMEKMLSALARLHTFWWGHPQFAKNGIFASVTKRIYKDFSALREEFSGFMDYLGDRLSLKRKNICERILDKYPDVILDHLSSPQKLTLVHNDAHPGNFFLPKNVSTNDVYIIDWAQWNVNFALRDVAYLIIFSWYPERREKMEKVIVQNYYKYLCEFGLTQYDWQTCWNDYRLYAIETILILFQIWTYHGEWHSHRWHQWEKSMQAFDDLKCTEFL